MNKTKSPFRKSRALLALAASFAMLAGQVAPMTARAADVLQDIDIYSLPPDASAIPNVLLVLDNSANWTANVNAGTCNVKRRDLIGSTLTETTTNVVSDADQGTKMAIEKCALYEFFASLELAQLAKINIGLMLHNIPNGGGDGVIGGGGNCDGIIQGNTGGYPRIHFTNITTVQKQFAFLERLASITIADDGGSLSALAETLFEAYQYFRSLDVCKGNLTSNRDANAFVNGSNPRRYNGPPLGCAQNHIIFLANGAPQESSTNAKKLLINISGAATQLSIPPTWPHVDVNEANNWADEYANFFQSELDLVPSLPGKQNMFVHTISVATGHRSEGDFPNYMAWVAEKGGGLGVKVDASPAATGNIVAKIKSAIELIFASVNAANSVFAAASLPVSANSQGTYLNQVFIGMFRPNADALPRWIGNLKQYQFAFVNNDLFLADSTNTAAVENTTGFVKDSGISFWTNDEGTSAAPAGRFWIEQNAIDPNYAASDSPDGPRVEKGAHAQWLRKTYRGDSSLTSGGVANRPVYTCTSTSCASSGTLDNFATSNSDIVYSTLNATGDPDKDLIVNFTRGLDNVTAANVTDVLKAQEEYTKRLNSTVRPSIHGDVLHSRPVAVNYATSATQNKVVVYYGGNDGLLRAINGNQTALKNNLTSEPGAELWSFVAPEHFGKLRRLRENSPQVLFPSTVTNLNATERDYFFDGPIGFYQNMSATPSAEIFIFPTMRRGGDAVYAFDVSDPTAPKFKWKITPATTGYTALGQTWSTPKPIRVQGLTDPVLIMGGGYDNTTEDPAMPDSTPPSTVAKGNRIYIINMRTGELLKELATDFSVPSDVSVVDSDGDGYVDRAYATDIQMQVYRIDIEDSSGARAPSAWEITKIADLRRRFGDAESEKAPSASGGEGSATSTGTCRTSPNDYSPTNAANACGGLTTPLRKTFFSPDVVITRDFTALFIGTGDREKPLKFGTADRFHFIKDLKTTKGAPTSVSLIYSYQLRPVSATTRADSDDQGCYLGMSDGEKIINQPVSFGGVTYFSTTKPTPPDSGSCYVGQSKAYAVPVFCRPPSKVTDLIGYGLPPSPVVGYVQIDGKLVPFIIGGPDTTSPIGGSKPPITVNPTRKRTYWYMENKDR